MPWRSNQESALLETSMSSYSIWVGHSTYKRASGYFNPKLTNPLRRPRSFPAGPTLAAGFEATRPGRRPHPSQKSRNLPKPETPNPKPINPKAAAEKSQPPNTGPQNLKLLRVSVGARGPLKQKRSTSEGTLASSRTSNSCGL